MFKEHLLFAALSTSAFRAAILLLHIPTTKRIVASPFAVVGYRCFVIVAVTFALTITNWLRSKTNRVYAIVTVSFVVIHVEPLFADAS